MWSFRLETLHISRRSSRAVYALACAVAGLGAQVQPKPAARSKTFFDTYCVTCHNQKLRTAGLALDSLDSTQPGSRPDVWERVIAKLRAGSMPPPGIPRPDAASYQLVASSLEN